MAYVHEPQATPGSWWSSPTEHARHTCQVRQGSPGSLSWPVSPVSAVSAASRLPSLPSPSPHFPHLQAVLEYTGESSAGYAWLHVPTSPSSLNASSTGWSDFQRQQQLTPPQGTVPVDPFPQPSQQPYIVDFNQFTGSSSDDVNPYPHAFDPAARLVSYGPSGMDHYGRPSVTLLPPTSPVRAKRGRPPKGQKVKAEHDSRKPFVCSYCPRRFGRKSDMTRHTHVHTGTRPHTCTFPGCGKQFIQTSALTVHSRVHTGEKPHVCPEDGCEKRFSDSSSLARHRKIHKKPYQCGFGQCPKGAMNWEKLHDHVLKTHKGFAFAMQALPSLLHIPDVFGYRKCADQRVFAVPLSIVQPSPTLLQLVVESRKCGDQIVGGSDVWIVKEPRMEYSLNQITFPIGDAPDSAAAGQTNDYYSEGLAHTSAPAIESSQQADWAQPTSFNGAVEGEDFQSHGVELAPSNALPLASVYSATSFPTTTPFTSMAIDLTYLGYGTDSVRSMMPIPQSVTLQANTAAVDGMPPIQDIPVRGQDQPNQAATGIYEQGLNGFVQSALAQHGNSNGVLDHPRMLGSPESAYLANQSVFAPSGFQGQVIDQAFMDHAQLSNDNAHSFSADGGPVDDMHAYDGYESHSPVPDLSASEAQSPAEEDTDSIPFRLADFTVKIDDMDTNGHLFPSQRFE